MAPMPCARLARIPLLHEPPTATGHVATSRKGVVRFLTLPITRETTASRRWLRVRWPVTRGGAVAADVRRRVPTHHTSTGSTASRRWLRVRWPVARGGAVAADVRRRFPTHHTSTGSTASRRRLRVRWPVTRGGAVAADVRRRFPTHHTSTGSTASRRRLRVHRAPQGLARCDAPMPLADLSQITRRIRTSTLLLQACVVSSSIIHSSGFTRRCYETSDCTTSAGSACARSQFIAGGGSDWRDHFQRHSRQSRHPRLHR